MKRSFDEWLYAPTFEETVCPNPFRNVVEKVYSGCNALDPYAPNPYDIETKIANLLKAELILLEGDVIYVKEHGNLIPLGEAEGLLAYYMHSDTKEARRAIDILETNFQGYFPITQDKVWRNGIRIIDPEGNTIDVDLKTLTIVDKQEKFPEFGITTASYETYVPLAQFFQLINSAIGDPWFFEKTIMYPFFQPFREKSQVLVGGGGNGKSMFMKIVQCLYGNKALTDAPQPNFTGHSAGVISYNFIGKRVVTFNDVEKPNAQFLEWMKRMITGNLEVKTPSGAWLSVPCISNFIMETNHKPEVLDLPAHRRRFIIREFDPDFALSEHMSSDELDVIGERGDLKAGDVVMYLLGIKSQIKDWTTF